MALPTSCLQSLTIKYSNKQEDHSACLLALLSHAKGYKIKNLTLHLCGVLSSEDFEISFLLYIARNEFLRNLVLKGSEYHLESVHRFLALPSILQAFGSGKGSLNQLAIIEKDKAIEEEWALTVQKHVASNLNRHRRRSGRLLKNLAQATTTESRQLTVVKALTSIDDASAQFAFLASNEGNLLDAMLQVLPGGEGATGPTKKRKHI